jgi:hypothetical protein
VAEGTIAQGDEANSPRRPSRIRRAVGRGTFILLLIVTAAFGFGLSDGDVASLRAFTRGVDQWQHDPEFRTIAVEYSIVGSGAMRSRPFGVPASRLILAIRSIPGLPKDLAVNPTSRAHYENFSRGPLSAYLHLCREQDVPDFVGPIEDLARKPNRTPADYRAWFDQRQMDFPLAKDAGARDSLAALIADTQADRSFVIRRNIQDLLGAPIAAIAGELGYPADPTQMTPAQQRAVLDRLDGYVRRHDPELWRTKQVSDFCGGIWAQVFGPPYNGLLNPALAIHAICRILFALLLLALLVRARIYVRRLRRAEFRSPVSAVT